MERIFRSSHLRFHLRGKWMVQLLLRSLMKNLQRMAQILWQEVDASLWNIHSRSWYWPTRIGLLPSGRGKCSELWLPLYLEQWGLLKKARIEPWLQTILTVHQILTTIWLWRFFVKQVGYLWCGIRNCTSKPREGRNLYKSRENEEIFSQTQKEHSGL